MLDEDFVRLSSAQCYSEKVSYSDFFERLRSTIASSRRTSVSANRAGQDRWSRVFRVSGRNLPMGGVTKWVQDSTCSQPRFVLRHESVSAAANNVAVARMAIAR